MNLLKASEAADLSIQKFGGTARDKKAFLLVMEFLGQHPERLSMKSKLIDQESLEYYLKFSNRFFQTRYKVEGPKPPATIPDTMVSYILEVYFDYPGVDNPRISKEHQHSMAAENMVGSLLERYIGTILEDHGWAWCSGDFIKAVDMVKKNPDGTWLLLQVKNRDNTENSSSSAIRSGTIIKKWFRSYSKKSRTNWETFPDTETVHLLSEEGFKEFVKNYLLNAKSIKFR